MARDARSKVARTVSEEERQRGYREQRAWLQGKSIAEARQALEARKATLEPCAYNDAGTVATGEYIEHLERERAWSAYSLGYAFRFGSGWGTDPLGEAAQAKLWDQLSEAHGQVPEAGRADLLAAYLRGVNYWRKVAGEYEIQLPGRNGGRVITADQPAHPGRTGEVS
jgi:hypothetical protein